MTESEILKAAVQKFGAEAQLRQLQEECAERDALREVVKRQRAALEFYSHNGSHVVMTKDMRPENGRIAKQAIAEADKILKGEK